MSRRNPITGKVEENIWDHELQQFVSYQVEDMDLPQLRALVERVIGVKPHHKTGRLRLIAMLNGLENEHISTSKG